MCLYFEDQGRPPQNKPITPHPYLDSPRRCQHYWTSIARRGRSRGTPGGSVFGRDLLGRGRSLDPKDGGKNVHRHEPLQMTFKDIQPPRKRSKMYCPFLPPHYFVGGGSPKSLRKGPIKTLVGSSCQVMFCLAATGTTQLWASGLMNTSSASQSITVHV